MSLLSGGCTLFHPPFPSVLDHPKAPLLPGLFSVLSCASHCLCSLCWSLIECTHLPQLYSIGFHCQLWRSIALKHSEYFTSYQVTVSVSNILFNYFSSSLWSNSKSCFYKSFWPPLLVNSILIFIDALTYPLNILMFSTHVKSYANVDKEMLVNQIIVYIWNCTCCETDVKKRVTSHWRICENWQGDEPWMGQKDQCISGPVARSRVPRKTAW